MGQKVISRQNPRKEIQVEIGIMLGYHPHAISRIVLLSIVAIIIIASLAAFYVILPGPSPASSTRSTSETSSATATVLVHMNGAGESTGNYAPQNITVIIGVNNTVEWVNDDSVSHTVTSLNNTFDSKNMSPGAVYNFTFTTVGSYPYFCEYHDWMTGTVVVKSA